MEKYKIDKRLLSTTKYYDLNGPGETLKKI